MALGGIFDNSEDLRWFPVVNLQLLLNYSCLFTFQLSLQDTVNLVAQYCKSQYDTVMQNQRGDSFYIRTHFNYDQPEMPGEMPFGKSEVFHVVDTLHNGVVGSWQALRVNPGNKDNKIHRGNFCRS